MWKKKDLNSAEFWEPILADQSFKDAVQKMFSLTSPKTFTVDDQVDGNGEDDAVKFDPETGEITG
ncbi:hypothetical protein D3C76_1766850 [compost metagenome]